MRAAGRQPPPDRGRPRVRTDSEGTGGTAKQKAAITLTPLQPSAPERPAALPPLVESEEGGVRVADSARHVPVSYLQAVPRGAPARRDPAPTPSPRTGRTEISHSSTGSNQRRETGPEEAGTPSTACNAPATGHRNALHRHDSEGSFLSQGSDTASVFVLSHAQRPQGAAAEGEGGSQADTRPTPRRRSSTGSTRLSDVAEVPGAIHLADGSRIEYRVAMPSADGRGTVLARPSEVEMHRVPLPGPRSTDSEGSGAVSTSACSDAAQGPTAPLRCYSPRGSMRLPTESGFVQAPLLALSSGQQRPRAQSLHGTPAVAAAGSSLARGGVAAQWSGSPVGSAQGAPVVQAAPPLVESGFLSADASLAQRAALQGAVSRGYSPPTSSAMRQGGMHRSKGNGFGASAQAGSPQGGDQGVGSNDHLARKLPPKETMFTRPAFGPGSEDELIRKRYEERRDSLTHRVARQGSRVMQAVPSPRRRWSIVRGSLVPRLQNSAATCAGSTGEGGGGSAGEEGEGGSGSKAGVRQAQEAVLSLRASVMRRRLAHGLRRASFSSKGSIEPSAEESAGEAAAAPGQSRSRTQDTDAVAGEGPAPATAGAAAVADTAHHQRPHSRRGVGDTSSDSEDDAGDAARGMSVDVGHSLGDKAMDPLQ